MTRNLSVQFFHHPNTKHAITSQLTRNDTALRTFGMGRHYFFTSRVKLDSTEKIFPPYPKHIVSIYGALMQFSVRFRMVSQSDTSHKYLAMCQQQTSLILSIYRMTGELLFEVTIPNHTVLIMNCRSVIFTCYKILPSNPESLESSPKSLKLTPCTRVATGATSATVSKCCFIKDPTCCFIFFGASCSW